MTPADFRATRKAMGYTQAQMAEFLHRAKSTVEKWEAGTMPIDPLAVAHIHLWGDFGAAMRELTFERLDAIQ